MRNLSIAAIMLTFMITSAGLVGCGSGGSDSSDDSSSSGGTSTTSGGTSTSGGTTSSTGGINPDEYTNGGTKSCETQSGHGSYVNVNCNECHNGGMKPMSYAGSAPIGTTVVIYEDSTKTKYSLPVNSQGNFCMRTKYGGNPSGGYTASASTFMISHQTNGYCALSGCHNSNMPIY